MKTNNDQKYYILAAIPFALCVFYLIWIFFKFSFKETEISSANIIGPILFYLIILYLVSFFNGKNYFGKKIEKINILKIDFIIFLMVIMYFIDGFSPRFFIGDLILIAIIGFLYSKKRVP